MFISIIVPFSYKSILKIENLMNYYKILMMSEDKLFS